MNDEERDRFLAAPRYAYLTTLNQGGFPITLPVWFEWDGKLVRFFTVKGSPKMKRIERDPRISLLVANDRNETEAWVAFDGQAKLVDADAKELLDRLAPRYWDLSDPTRSSTLEDWRRYAHRFCVIEMEPERIRQWT